MFICLIARIGATINSNIYRITASVTTTMASIRYDHFTNTVSSKLPLQTNIEISIDSIDLSNLVFFNTFVATDAYVVLILIAYICKFSPHFERHI